MTTPSFDDLSIGDEAPVLVVEKLSRTNFVRYAGASGDFNPIHVDPDFAAGGPFGRTIAHGLMTLAFVAEMLNAWSGGAFDAGGELDIAFVGPVFVGDTVEVSGMVEDIEQAGGRAVAVVKLGCRAGDRAILAGMARMPVGHAREKAS